jgi:hypothetical protein
MREASDFEATTDAFIYGRMAGQPQPSPDDSSVRIRRTTEACVMENTNSAHPEWTFNFLPSAVIWLAIIAGLLLL